MSFTRWRSLVDGAEIDVSVDIPDGGVDYFDEPITIEDFEDFNDWDSDSGWTLNSGGNFNGQYAEYEGSSGDGRNLHGVENLPFVGDAFDIFVRGGGSSSFVRINTVFMVEDGGNYQEGDDGMRVSLRPNDSPSFRFESSQLYGGDSVTEDPSLGSTTWYRIEIRIFEDKIVRAFLWPYDGVDPTGYNTDDAISVLEAPVDSYPDENNTGGFTLYGASSDGEIWDIFRLVGNVEKS